MVANDGFWGFLLLETNEIDTKNRSRTITFGQMNKNPHQTKRRKKDQKSKSIQKNRSKWKKRHLRQINCVYNNSLIINLKPFMSTILI